MNRRKASVWQNILDTGTGPDGKRRRYFETIRGRKSDAQKKLNELLVNLEKGIYTPPGRLTMEEHLHNWLEGYGKANCSQRTLDGYKSIIETHLIPALGQVQLKHLHSQVIQSYYGKACERLFFRTIHHHRVLSQSLKYAVRQGYLSRNPCEFMDPHSPKGRATRTLTSGEVEVLFENAQDNYYYSVIYTAVSTGLRQADQAGRSGRCKIPRPETYLCQPYATTWSQAKGYLGGVRSRIGSLYYGHIFPYN